MASRRRLLAACSGIAGSLLTGCLSGTASDPDAATDGTTESCSASEPPRPTDATAEPRSYPERPTELTTDSVEAFVRAYERAYQYNAELADNPVKIGRTNEFTVSVHSITVTSNGGRFAAEVSGQLQWDILDSGAATPETPTETPLPMGHGPFEASYVVTARTLRRDGVVVDCW